MADESWIHLKYLPLADPNFGKPGSIHIIVSADSYGQIIKPELIKGDLMSPIAQLILFGWALTGPVASTLVNKDSICHYTVEFVRSFNSLLDAKGPFEGRGIFKSG